MNVERMLKNILQRKMMKIGIEGFPSSYKCVNFLYPKREYLFLKGEISKVLQFCFLPKFLACDCTSTCII